MRAEFSAMVSYVKPDVIFGTESWLQPAILSSEVFPDDYVAYRRDRGSLGGGVFILVHKNLVSTAQPELDANTEMIWAKIHMQESKDLFLGCFYMPHRSPADLTELDKTLQKITGKHSGKQILLAGDFNCPDINWDTAAVAPGASDRHLQQTLVDLTTAAQLTQIHEEPTRNGNTIDLVFSTNPSLIQYSASIPGLSDHEAVVADLDTCPQRRKKGETKMPLPLLQSKVG